MASGYTDIQTIEAAILISADRETVFRHLISEASIREWWTADAHSGSVAGEPVEFGFYGRQTIVAGIIEELAPPARLVWHFTAGHEDYRDTRFVFVLEAVGEATRLRVTQLNERGWPPALKEHGETGWRRVMRSLKAWMETGKGDPISPD